MKILFIGTVRFSRVCLESVIKNGEVVGIVYGERNKWQGDYYDLRKVGKGIPHCSDIEIAHELKPDVIFAFGWNRMIPKEILDIPRLGVIGSHPTLLPEGRGHHPIIWAIIKGLKESGLTFFFMNERVDAGDILWQGKFKIEDEDDAGDVYRKVEGVAVEAIPVFMKQLADGDFPRVKQDESKATYWRRRVEKDGEIDWSFPQGTARLIRALMPPYSGAHTYINGQKYTVRMENGRKDMVASKARA